MARLGQPVDESLTVTPVIHSSQLWFVSVVVCCCLASFAYLKLTHPSQVCLHAIHHLALMRPILSGELGLDVGSDFGVAPSTIVHREWSKSKL